MIRILAFEDEVIVSRILIIVAKYTPMVSVGSTSTDATSSYLDSNLQNNQSSATTSEMDSQIIRSLVCYKAMKLAQSLLQHDNVLYKSVVQSHIATIVNDRIRTGQMIRADLKAPEDFSLVQSIFKILSRAPRNLLWFPSLLCAAELLEVCSSFTQSHAF
jgi:hypothetical protein